MADLIQVKNLRTSFFTPEGEVRAIDGVSFEIAEGKTLGLVGESGCGKSVTSLSIMRLVPPPGRVAAGRVLFEGEDLLAKDAEAMRRVRGARIACSFESPSAVSRLGWSGAVDTIRPSFRLAEAMRAQRNIVKGERQ